MVSDSYLSKNPLKCHWPSMMGRKRERNDKTRREVDEPKSPCLGGRDVERKEMKKEKGGRGSFEKSCRFKDGAN